MSYILKKPYTNKEYADFVCKYQGLAPYENKNAFYFLEPNEIVINGTILLDPDYEEKQAQVECERISKLQLTKADVLLALYEDKKITPDDIKEMLKDNIPALIKFDYASSYYRGDEVVIALGNALGYTKDDLDYLFENKKLK